MKGPWGATLGKSLRWMWERMELGKPGRRLLKEINFEVWALVKSTTMRLQDQWSNWVTDWKWEEKAPPYI